MFFIYLLCYMLLCSSTVFASEDELTSSYVQMKQLMLRDIYLTCNIGNKQVEANIGYVNANKQKLQFFDQGNDFLSLNNEQIKDIRKAKEDCKINKIKNIWVAVLSDHASLRRIAKFFKQTNLFDQTKGNLSKKLNQAMSFYNQLDLQMRFRLTQATLEHLSTFVTQVGKQGVTADDDFLIKNEEEKFNDFNKIFQQSCTLICDQQKKYWGDEAKRSIKTERFLSITISMLLLIGLCNEYICKSNPRVQKDFNKIAVITLAYIGVLIKTLSSREILTREILTKKIQKLDENFKLCEFNT